jgi:hypothetical protein
MKRMSGYIMKRSIYLASIRGSVLSAVMLCAAFAQAASNNVDVIVNNALYSGGSITASLNTYCSDLRAQGYNPILTTTAFASPDALRSHLAAEYNASGGLAGAVLIGNLPVQHYERYNETFSGQSNVPYEKFATDLYYMDLNGTWSDSDHNGTLDTHSGSVSPEIFVSRMSTPQLAYGRTEAELVNNYLAKDHAYRQGQIRLPQNGLAYIDNDWTSSAASWGASLGKSVAGTVTIVSDPATTTSADYQNRIARATSPGYESVLLAVHSASDNHVFKEGNGQNDAPLYGYQIAAEDPQAIAYNLFSCSAGNYEAPMYLSGEYVFDYTSKALMAVSSTKTGGMLDYDNYYTPLGNGATYGQAYLDWWQAEAADGLSARDEDWFDGMAMTGDPLLRTEAYAAPEPSTFALLSIGAISLLAHVCRRRRGR